MNAVWMVGQQENLVACLLGVTGTSRHGKNSMSSHRNSISRKSELCGQEDDQKQHLAAFDRALSILDKYNHGRCDIYHTGDKVYFICTKPVR